MKVYLKKLPGNLLTPDSDKDADLLKGIGTGKVVSAEVKQPRNYEFHKKYMALITVGYEAFEPDGKEYKGETVQKNFDRFRKDIQILAGYCDPVYNIRGEVRMESKSIAFGKMAQEDFEKLYEAVVDVLLRLVLKNYTRDDLDAVVNEIAGFA